MIKTMFLVVDDDTFPCQKVSLILPKSAKQLSIPKLFGSSQGLFCLYGLFKKEKHTFFGPKMAVIWNPTIRKSVDILLPDVLNTKNQYDTSVGFGVCPRSLDPILVNIIMECSSKVFDSTARITWLAEVFRLSSGAWKSLSVTLLQRKIALRVADDQVAIDRFIYWGASDEADDSHLILSFDMISEEFMEIHLPNDLACAMEVYVFKLKESLAVLQFDMFDIEVDVPDCHVWMMENGDEKSFTKIYTIMSHTPEASFQGVFGSRKSGEPIIAMKKQSEEEDYELFEYEHNSGLVNHIGISAKRSLFCASPYTETLILLNY